MSDAVLRARDWVVEPIIDHAEAVAFVARQHYAHGAANTSVYRHGLYRADDAPILRELWGVALWMPPTRRAAESVAPDQPRGVLCLSRLVVDPAVPKNGASFLLGRSMRLVDRTTWPTLLTYADTGEGHTGAIYRATNWTELGQVPGSDNWITPDGQRRGRKRGARNLSTAEMVAAGFERLPAKPKVKFVQREAA